MDSLDFRGTFTQTQQPKDVLDRAVAELLQGYAAHHIKATMDIGMEQWESYVVPEFKTQLRLPNFDAKKESKLRRAYRLYKDGKKTITQLAKDTRTSTQHLKDFFKLYTVQTI